MDEPVLLRIDGPIARLTLNRPQVMNALDRAMAERLAAAVTQIAGDRAIRVVVVSGAGDGFMAGGDIGLFKETLAVAPAERRVIFQSLVDTAHAAILGLRRLPVPVIASIHGPVAGFGMSLLMACDLAVAADSAIFTLAYSLIGLSPDGGSTYFLPRHVGSKKAMEIALLGDRFDAATALRLGLVNDVVAAAELAARVTALAERLARGPGQAYAATKRLLDQSALNSIEAQLDAEKESLVRSTTTADFTEGVEAFLARRPPRFRH
jgi:2-(1,2-epoxy-1,2-dihydrophenyl)acetyl-CoA isomerase